jgi:hypothetical protein
MADLRPLGSEKLQGMDKIRRIMEIARYNESPKQDNNDLSTTNYTITLSDGKTYGIVKEKLGYIIKSGLNESTLDYTESMKHRKHYRSYSEAMKRLNIMSSEINRVTGYEYGIPLIGEQAEAKKKFVLKQNKPKPADAGAPPAEGDMGAGAPPPADAGVPPMDAGAPPADAGAPPAEGDMGAGAPPAEGDMGAGAPPAGEEGAPPTDDMGGEPPTDDMGEEGMEPPMDDMGEPEDEEEPAGPLGLKSIQKLTGRLSQKIRSFDKDKGMDSQDIKYVVNSILSAINLDNLDEDDRDDIIGKFDEVDEYDMGDEEIDMGGDEDLGMEEPDMGGDMMSPDMGAEAPPAPEKAEGYSHIMDSLFTESKVEKVLSGYFDIKPEEKPILEEKRKKDFLKGKLNRIEVKKEFVKLCESLSQLEAANEFYKEHKNAKFIGKTNKENLVFVVENRQYKVTPRGRII